MFFVIVLQKLVRFRKGYSIIINRLQSYCRSYPGVTNEFSNLLINGSWILSIAI